MPIITIASGKGGSGKTTSVMGLAGGLKRLGSPPDAVIDLDYGASLTRAYGYQPESPFSEALLDGRVTFGAALHETAEDIPLIPATAGLGAISRDKLPAWRTRLKELGQNNLLIIDTSDDILSTAVAAAILAADILCIPVPLEPKAYSRTFPEIAGLLASQSHNPEIVFFGTMVDKRPSLFRHMMQQLSNDGVELAGLVPRSVAIGEADLKQVSIVASDPKSKPSVAYVEIAATCLARLRKMAGARPGVQGRAVRGLPHTA